MCGSLIVMKRHHTTGIKGAHAIIVARIRLSHAEPAGKFDFTIWCDGGAILATVHSTASIACGVIVRDVMMVMMRSKA